MNAGPEDVRHPARRRPAIGTLWMVIAGSLLHFAWEWSGRSDIVAIFTPVNESTWEHLKMGYWTLVTFSVWHFFAGGRRLANFAVAYASGAVVFCLMVIGVFYGYTGLLGRNVLWMDIATYVVACAACQVNVYWILKWRPLGRFARPFVRRLALVGFFGLGLLFAVWTYSPPEIGLFRDPVTGAFGVIP